MKTLLNGTLLTVALAVVGTVAASVQSLSAREAVAPRPEVAKDPAPQIYRSFEFRAVSDDPRANDETDFKGKTSVWSTEERVAFLNAYSDYAATWFGDPQLDTLAVPQNEVAQRLAAFKPQPLPRVRRTLPLSDGWRQQGVPTAGSSNRAAAYSLPPGAVIADGQLILSAGTNSIVGPQSISGWRYELRWEAQGTERGQKVNWILGGVLRSSQINSSNGQRFRFQADVAEGRGYLSADGVRVAEFPLTAGLTNGALFAAQSAQSIKLRNLVLIDYRRRDNVRQPYEPVVLVDEGFQPQPATNNWAAPGYDDRGWQPATLPCVRGGFREAGEDLLLRRAVVLPVVQRAWLDVEAIDRSGEIHVNGQLAATLTNCLPVRLDLSHLLKPGTNVLALKVNHNWLADPSHHAPADRAAGWFAGRAALHLILGKAAIQELLVHTASLTGDGNATQVHRLRLENAGDQPFAGTVEIRYQPWFPADGAVVATGRAPVRIAAHGVAETNVRLELKDALLWSPETPRLYAVEVTLRDESGAAVDDAVVTTGVRTVAQKDGQLLLNGQPALLLGAQIMGLRPFPDVENAAKYNRCTPAEMLLGEMLAIKNMGGNLLRVHSHLANNSQGSMNDPRVAEMADQLGLTLFWSGPAWIREGDERSVDVANVGAYLRQVFNHPSIVNWELSNHPNTFKNDDSPQRTHDFVRRTVDAVLAVDDSRLITPTTFWQHTHYANDLGTLDWKNRPITPVPQFIHPLVTRGSQDAITGYGAEWSVLREWPRGLAADCLGNRTRAWFNFEHEESAAQPNWNLSAGWPWHRLRSYEADYEKGSVGRVLGFDEWRVSQGWQAFSAYESMRKQIFHGVAGFSWCTIEGGANSGTYEKPLLDPFGHAKLAWHIHKPLAQPVFAGSDNADVVYGPADRIAPAIFNFGPARVVDLTAILTKPDGSVVDQKSWPQIRLEGGCAVTRLEPWRPCFPTQGFFAVEYQVADFVDTSRPGFR